MRNAVSLIALAAVTGCSMATSVPLGDPRETPLKANLTYHLPRAVMELTVGSNESGFLAASLKRELVRDADHAYALRYTPSILSDDTLTVSVDPETGFLDLVEAKAIDRTFDAIVKGAETGATFALSANATERSFKFDPHRDLAELNARIAYAGIQVECPDCAPPTPRGPEISGFYVRPAVHVELVVRNLATRQVVQRLHVLSPNGSPLVAMPLNRSAGVERMTKYEAFVDGEPVKMHQSKPSEALGVVTGLAAAVGEVVAAPVAGAANQLAEATAQTDAVEQETKLLEAEARRLEASTALEEARKASSDGTSQRDDGTGAQSDTGDAASPPLSPDLRGAQE